MNKKWDKLDATEHLVSSICSLLVLEINNQPASPQAQHIKDRTDYFYVQKRMGWDFNLGFQISAYCSSADWTHWNESSEAPNG